MGWLIYGLVQVFVIIAAVSFYHRRRQAKEIHFDEVPDLVRDDVLRRVPTLTVDRVVMKPDKFRLQGEAEGQPIQIKVTLRGVGAARHIYRFEIQLETRSAYRSLKGKRLIDPRKVPEAVIAQARQAAATYGAPFDDITRVKAATVQGRNAYDIKAWSGDWRVDVRNGLYMPTVVAKQYNPTIKAFYDRLVENGKSKMVAIIASMRKLITILNVMIRDGTMWNENFTTT